MNHVINSVYPWGRSGEEYRGMFDLQDSDLAGRILDCGGGPASFCAEANGPGVVVACDPLYMFPAAEIERRVRETYSEMVELVRRDHERFVWNRIRSPEHLGEIRLNAMTRFLEDYRRSHQFGRYVAGKLPDLPFTDNYFHLALVSHLLFLYSGTMSSDFHFTAIRELLRCASEVRIFPLLDMKGNVSSHLDEVVERLGATGHRTELRSVPYEFQKGGDTMLRVWR